VVVRARLKKEKKGGGALLQNLGYARLAFKKGDLLVTEKEERTSPLSKAACKKLGKKRKKGSRGCLAYLFNNRSCRRPGEKKRDSSSGIWAAKGRELAFPSDRPKRSGAECGLEKGEGTASQRRREEGAGSFRGRGCCSFTPHQTLVFNEKEGIAFSRNGGKGARKGSPAAKGRALRVSTAKARSRGKKKDQNSLDLVAKKKKKKRIEVNYVSHEIQISRRKGKRRGSLWPFMGRGGKKGEIPTRSPKRSADAKEKEGRVACETATTRKRREKRKRRPTRKNRGEKKTHSYWDKGVELSYHSQGKKGVIQKKKRGTTSSQRGGRDHFIMGRGKRKEVIPLPIIEEKKEKRVCILLPKRSRKEDVSSFRDRASEEKNSDFISNTGKKRGRKD